VPVTVAEAEAPVADTIEIEVLGGCRIHVGSALQAIAMTSAEAGGRVLLHPLPNLRGRAIVPRSFAEYGPRDRARGLGVPRGRTALLPLCSPGANPK
jgi:hypothetical protein